jgi:hypothetical protein
MDAPLFLLQRDVVKDEEHRSWVLPVSPPDLGSSPRVWVATHSDQVPSPPTRTRGQDGSVPTPSGADPSCARTCSGTAPPAVEGASGMDAEACPVTTSAKDTSGASSSVRPVVDASAYTDDGFGCAVSACDVAAAPSRATSTIGALDAPSSICSHVDTATGRASPISIVATPAPLLLAPSTTPADSWRVGRSARLFFVASLSGAPPPPAL